MERPSRRVLAVATLLGLVVLSGCQVQVELPADGGVETPGSGSRVEAVVTAVVDGDTIEVRFDDGSRDTVRLLGIDTPEVTAETEPGEWEGVSDGACLRGYGQAATEWVTEAVLDERVTLVGDTIADDRGSYGRLLRYVVHENTTINERLVAEGLARATDAYEGHERQTRYLELEAERRQAGVGAWSCD